MRSALVFLCCAALLVLASCSVSQSGRDKYQLPKSYDAVVAELASRSSLLETYVGSRKWIEAKDEARIIENLANHLNRMVPASAESPEAFTDYQGFVRDLYTSAALMHREVADHRTYHAVDIMHDYADRLNRITQRFGPGKTFSPTLSSNSERASW